MTHTQTSDLRPGESAGPKHCIFQEIRPGGTTCPNYVAVNAGEPLPQTSERGNLWHPISIHDLHAGIS